MVDSKLQGVILNNEYKLEKKLGSGAFGDIYLGIDKNNSEQYAVKVEKSSTKHPQINFEVKLYKYLNSDYSDNGIPRIYKSGQDQSYNFMVIDLLGKSLEELFNESKKKFSLKTVLMLGEQMLQRIQFIHSKSFLHRDLKPDNFLMGNNKHSQKVFIIDFGLAKRYMSREGLHIPYKEGKSLTGTARYASVNTHIGLEQARRDDLESLGYILMYFLRGALPWMNLKSTNKKDKYERIKEVKMQTPIDTLCKGYPPQFNKYFSHIKNLKFEDKPDYLYLLSLFKECMKQHFYENDFVYDWIKISVSRPPLQNNNHIQNVKADNEEFKQEYNFSKNITKFVTSTNNSVKNANQPQIYKITTHDSNEKQMNQQTRPPKPFYAQRYRERLFSGNYKANMNNTQNRLPNLGAAGIKKSLNKQLTMNLPNPRITVNKQSR